MEQVHFTSVRFIRYKTFREYNITLTRFNILVGPNNSGKSTILGAFRILSEAIRKARRLNPTYVDGPQGQTLGYSVELRNIPIATENVFFDYDDSEPALIRFKISNGNELILFFPTQGACNLICETKGRSVTSTSIFKSQFNITVSFVPILGPVEHEEQLYLPEAARLALLTHGAARNFRNIWYHNSDDFNEFRSLVKSTWPGMDIERPQVDLTHKKPLLRMFCPEERIPREIFWAGFGFQVWCQMLTYIVRGQDSSLFLIDEPDIYLHADLQRQLLGILKELGPDILIATHSIEMISDADPGDLLIIDKKRRWAKRVTDLTQVQSIFQVLGSNINPILTQLAKTRRALYVEGKDYQILSRFAFKLNYNQVANRSDYAVIPVEGFNPAKVQSFTQGIEKTLGSKVLTAVIFDRDYRSQEECEKEQNSLKRHCFFTHIHQRKELENFLLAEQPIRRAIERRVTEQKRRSNSSITFDESVKDLFALLTDPLKYDVASQYLSKRRTFVKSKNSSVDNSTIDKNLMKEFDEIWFDMEQRLLIVPGKDVIAALNEYLQNNYGITITTRLIVESFQKNEIPVEMVTLIEKLEEFRSQPVS